MRHLFWSSLAATGLLVAGGGLLADRVDAEQGRDFVEAARVEWSATVPTVPELNEVAVIDKVIPVAESDEVWDVLDGLSPEHPRIATTPATKPVVTPEPSEPEQPDAVIPNGIDGWLSTNTGISLPIIEATSADDVEHKLDRGGAVWMPWSSDLDGDGRIALIAHRTSKNGPFSSVFELSEGDSAVIELPDGTRRSYHYDSTDIVHHTDTHVSAAEAGSRDLILVSCGSADGTPGGTSHRIVVRFVLSTST